MLRRPSATTLYVLPASASPLALVIRRGPSKWWHFLLWNRDTQDYSFGSWFNGMVYPHRCDLSARGDQMLILAYRGAKEPLAWTALCRPPFVRANVFWAHKSVRFGGGFFDKRLPIAWLNLPPESVADRRGPCSLEFGYLDDQGTCFGSYGERLERDGWRESGTAKTNGNGRPLHTWTRPSPSRLHELVLQYHAPAAPAWDVAQFPDDLRYTLRSVADGSELALDQVSWAGWNGRGELTLAASGALYTADATNPFDSLRLVVDLNPLQPRKRNVEGVTEHAELKSDG